MINLRNTIERKDRLAQQMKDNGYYRESIALACFQSNLIAKLGELKNEAILSEDFERKTEIYAQMHLLNEIIG